MCLCKIVRTCFRVYVHSLYHMGVLCFVLFCFGLGFFSHEYEEQGKTGPKRTGLYTTCHIASITLPVSPREHHQQVVTFASTTSNCRDETSKATHRSQPRYCSHGAPQSAQSLAKNWGYKSAPKTPEGKNKARRWADVWK